MLCDLACQDVFCARKNPQDALVRIHYLKGERVVIHRLTFFSLSGDDQRDLTPICRGFIKPYSCPVRNFLASKIRQGAVFKNIGLRLSVRTVRILESKCENNWYL